MTVVTQINRRAKHIAKVSPKQVATIRAYSDNLHGKTKIKVTSKFGPRCKA